MPLFCDAHMWPACFDDAAPKPDLSHPYWVFRSLQAASDARFAVTQVRSGDYKSEQWQKALRHAQHVHREALAAPVEERAAVYEKGNSELASWVVADAQKHLATLLLDLSIASPLTFKMNPNL